MKKITLFTFALITVCFVTTKAASTGTYKIVNKISIEGNEKWDYIYSDDSSNRLYVSHGTQVQVVDEVTGKVIGKISDLKGVHGIAIAPKLNKGFISTKIDNSVTIFDTNTFEVVKRVEMTVKGPDAILFDRFSQKVFVFNGHSNNATTYAVESVWPLAPGAEPTGLALDNKTHRLFSVCANKLMIVVDAESGKILTNLPIGEKVDGAVFYPESKCVFSSNGDATMTVVKEDENDQYSVFANVPTQKGARTIAVNKKTHHIYLPAAEFEAATAGQKGKLIPGTFVILDIVPE